MTPDAWIIVAVIAGVLFLMSLGALILALRARKGPGTGRRVTDEVASLRSEVNSMKDRNRLLEDRFERYEHSHTDTRESLDRMREDVESRLTRVSSHDTIHRELQEQIHELRKEHQVLMERDERHERRVLELQEQLGDIRSEIPSRARADGEKLRR